MLTRFIGYLFVLVLITVGSALSAEETIPTRQIILEIPECIFDGSCNEIEQMEAHLALLLGAPRDLAHLDLFASIDCGSPRDAVRLQTQVDDLCDWKHAGNMPRITAAGKQVERLFQEPEVALSQKVALLKWCMSDMSLSSDRTISDAAEYCLADMAQIFPSLFEQTSWTLNEDAQLAIGQRTHEQVEGLYRLMRGWKKMRDEFPVE